MANKYIQDLFTANHFFGDVECCPDVSAVDRDIAILSINDSTKSVESLLELRKLKKLKVASIKTDVLPILAQLQQLELLCIQFCSKGFEVLSPLGSLSNLKCLILDSLRQPSSIEFLTRLKKLRGLEIQNLRQVRDLSPISKLTNLQELKIETGGMLSGQLAMDTLQPLAALKKLEYLWLFVLSKDSSLEPLSHLKKLKKLLINGLYPWQEYPKLKASLPKTNCEWFEKRIIEWGLTCSRCGEPAKVGLVGKGARKACSICQPKKVEEWIAAYEAEFEKARSGQW
ncbi:MAG: hypothetical protein AAF483_27805 [Planctomycetota bacterium]